MKLTTTLDVLKVSVASSETVTEVEQLTINFNDTGMTIEWGTTVVSVPISKK